MTQKVIIFDFDGTIADTVDALVTIANRLAREFGYIPINSQELAHSETYQPEKLLNILVFHYSKSLFFSKK